MPVADDALPQTNASPARSRVSVATLGSVAVFLLLLAGQAIYCFERPAGPFDAEVYVALLNGGGQETYRQALQDCAAQLPGPHNQCSTAGAAADVANYTPAEFQTFLRFYRVKPLYTASAMLLHRGLHLSAFVALRALSMLSLVVVGLTLALWLRHHLSMSAACLCALLIVSLPQVTLIGKFLLPDIFSLALMLPALYAILYLTDRLWVRLLLLAVLPLARPDNIILSLLLGALLLYRATPDRPRLALRLGALFVGCVAFNSLLSHATHGLSYTILFNHSFLNFSRPSLYPSMRLTAHDYIQTELAEAPKAILLFFPAPLFLSALALADRTSWQPLRDLIVAATVSAFARLPLFPAEEERYYTWWLVIAAAGAAAMVGQRVLARNSWFARPLAPSGAQP